MIFKTGGSTVASHRFGVFTDTLFAKLPLAYRNKSDEAKKFFTFAVGLGVKIKYFLVFRVID